MSCSAVCVKAWPASWSPSSSRPFSERYGKGLSR